MNGRKRTVQVKFYVTEEERKLIIPFVLHVYQMGYEASGVVGADVIHKERLKFIQGMDLFKVKPIQEPFTHGPEIPGWLGFGGAVPYRCVQEHGADGAADQGELLIDVGGSRCQYKVCQGCRRWRRPASALSGNRKNCRCRTFLRRRSCGNDRR